jgi:hypothetical protein
MSDQTLELFLHYGTAAERALFTPDPAAGIQPLYVWYETDTGDLFVFDTTWHAGGGGGGGGTGDVVGPASAVDDRIATFDTTTGKLLQDGGSTIAGVIAAAVAAAAAAILPVNLSGANATGTLAAGRFPALTGDVTTVAGALAATLAATAVTPGTYGTASNVPQLTVDAKGRLTGVVNVPFVVGTGDVVGPASAVDDHLATFDTTTGKLLQDGGGTIGDVIAAAVSAAVAAILPVNLSGANATGTLAAGRFPALTGDVTSVAGALGTTLAAGSASNLNAGTLPAGRLPALTGDVTSVAGAAATTLAAGSASNLNAGTLAAARMPALTGHITSTVGTVATSLAAAQRTRTIVLSLDGGGVVITPGVKGYIRIPVAGTLTGWTIVGDVSGSIVIDVWKDTFANFPPVNADSITNAHEPVVAAAQAAEDTNITDWTTTAIAAGDVLGFNVDSVSGFTRVALELTMEVT